MDNFDLLQKYLGMPKLYVKELDKTNQFMCFAHSKWIESILTNSTLPEFHLHEQLTGEEMHALLLQNNTPFEWRTVLIIVYEQFKENQFALAMGKRHYGNEQEKLAYSQLLHYVSHTNYTNLWKRNFKKYSNSLPTMKKKLSALVARKPANDIFMEILNRFYGCPIFDLVSNKISKKSCGDFRPHLNILPVLCVFKTESHFLLLHLCENVHTMAEYVTFSPRVFTEHYNRALFIVYQYAHLFKDCHDRGVILGDLRMSDVFIGPDLLVQVVPDIKNNIFLVAAEKPADAIPRPFLDNSLQMSTYRWIIGDLSNLDYLLILNAAAGRLFGDPARHFVIPWVSDLGGNKPNSYWRDLTKSQYRINKGDRQLDLTFVTSSNGGANPPHHVSDVLSEITYYVYMARRTPRNVLTKHVRSHWVPGEYPMSIQRLQAWTPDECIPEFFTDPLVFKSIHEDLSDLEVPSWAMNPEHFVQIHRDMLESRRVADRLHHWIDLTFGYKLTGTHAVKAKNVCLNLAENNTSMTTSGVVQLFDIPHPRRNGPARPGFDKHPPKNNSLKEEINNVSPASDDENEDQHQFEDKSAIKLSKELNPYFLMDLIEKQYWFHLNIFGTNPTVNLNCTTTGDFKRDVASKRLQEMQILGCLLTELFLNQRLRTRTSETLELRIATCTSLKDSLPLCVRQAVNVLLSQRPPSQQSSGSALVFQQQPITDNGLPPCSAHQILQPLLHPFIIPFPSYVPKLHSALTLSNHIDSDHDDFRVKLFVQQFKDNFFESKDEIDLVYPFVHEFLVNLKTREIFLRTEMFKRFIQAIGVEHANKLLLPTVVKFYQNQNSNGFIYTKRFLIMMNVCFGLDNFLVNILPLVIEAIASTTGNSHEHFTNVESTNVDAQMDDQSEVGIFSFDKEDTPASANAAENPKVVESSSEEDEKIYETCSSQFYVRSPDIPIPNTNFESKKGLSMDDNIVERNQSDVDVVNEEMDDIKLTISKSIIWFASRLGPVLTAKYITRHLLKVLSMCYTGQTALYPFPIKEQSFSAPISKYKVFGDVSAKYVLQALSNIVCIYGEQFALIQYLPTIRELISIAMNKQKSASSVQIEGSLIGAMAVLQTIFFSLLSDSSLMDSLQEMIIENILVPILNLTISRKDRFPSGLKGRQCLVAKFIDTVYYLSLRIGAEMTRIHLSAKILQPFFLAFDLDSDYLLTEVEMKETFSASFASRCYEKFAHYLGEETMRDCLLNYLRIKELCFQKVPLIQSNTCKPTEMNKKLLSSSAPSGSIFLGFGSNVDVMGNKIEVDRIKITQACTDQQDIVHHLITTSIQSRNAVTSETTRHLRGNWLAYWEHEIGLRSSGNVDADCGSGIGNVSNMIISNEFQCKQIKLQTFVGHTSSVRALLPFDTNENSLISGSRDKTVKVWSVRNQGSGSCHVSCQLSYTHHKQSVRAICHLRAVRRVASCDCTIHLWDPFVFATNNKAFTIVGGGDVSTAPSIAIIREYGTPCPHVLLAAGTNDYTLRFVDTRMRSFIHAGEFKVSASSSGSAGWPRTMCVSPNGHWVAIGQSTGLISVLDLRMGLLLSSWKGHTAELLQTVVIDENTIISSSLDHMISVWNVHDGKIKNHLKGMSEPVHCLQVHKNEGTLIAGTTGNRIGIYSNHNYLNTDGGLNEVTTTSQTKIRSDIFKGVLTSMAILPLNRLLLLGSDNGHITLLA